MNQQPIALIDRKFWHIGYDGEGFPFYYYYATDINVADCPHCCAGNCVQRVCFDDENAEAYVYHNCKDELS